jgi:hypothetical protein
VYQDATTIDSDPYGQGLLPTTSWCEVQEEEKVYCFEGEVVTGKLFNAVAHIERSGVPNGI